MVTSTLVPEGVAHPDRAQIKAAAVLVQERTVIVWDPEKMGYVWFTHNHMLDPTHACWWTIWTDIKWDSKYPEFEDDPTLYELMTE